MWDLCARTLGKASAGLRTHERISYVRRFTGLTWSVTELRAHLRHTSPAVRHTSCLRTRLCLGHGPSYCRAFLLQFSMHLCARRWDSPWRCAHASIEIGLTFGRSPRAPPPPSASLCSLLLSLVGFMCGQIRVVLHGAGEKPVSCNFYGRSMLAHSHASSPSGCAELSCGVKEKKAG